MPTSSIFAELKFETEEDIQKLVNALEQAVNDTTPPIKVNYKLLTIDEIKELFMFHEEPMKVNHTCWSCTHRVEEEINNVMCLWCEKHNHKINYSREETCKSWE